MQNEDRNSLGIVQESTTRVMVAARKSALTFFVFFVSSLVVVVGLNFFSSVSNVATGLEHGFAHAILTGDSVQLKQGIGSFVESGVFSGAWIRSATSNSIIAEYHPVFSEVSLEGTASPTGVLWRDGVPYVLLPYPIRKASGEMLATLTVACVFPLTAVIFCLIAAGAMIFFVSRYLSEKFRSVAIEITRPVVLLSSFLDSVKDDEGVTYSMAWQERFRFREINDVYVRFLDVWNRLLTSQKLERELTFIQGSLETAKRVAHDIRSPLATVNAVIATAKGLKDEDRDMLRRAVNQIKGIADDVLKKKSKEQMLPSSGGLVEPSSESTKQRLAWTLYQLETEFLKRGTTKIELQIEDSALFSELPKSLLYRVLSNLINNSIEAYSAGREKRVLLKLRKNDDMAEIEVQDFGNGIPQTVISRVGDKGFSFGKESSSSAGNGLGVFSAKEALRSLGGSLNISSEEGKGTTVVVRLPMVSPPSWFVTRIDSSQYEKLICADDNEDIRELYRKNLKNPTIVSTTNELKELMRAHLGSNVLYFIDYDFNESTTGLDLIEMFDLGGNAVLVTGVAGDEAIQARCEKAGCRLVAKGGLVKVLNYRQ